MSLHLGICRSAAASENLNNFLNFKTPELLSYFKKLFEFFNLMNKNSHVLGIKTKMKVSFRAI